MKNPNQTPSADAAGNGGTFDAVAAAWLSLRDGGLDAGQESELARWLAEDPRHASAFAALEETWSSLDALGAVRPAGDAAPDPALLVRNMPSRLRQVLPVALAAAAAIVLSFTVWSHWPRTEQVLKQHAVTEVGVQQALDLPDGSVIRLNTDSAVEVRYFANERRVRLVRGEAHFTVASNPACPFIVSAGKVDVQAVGTAFNVRLRTEAIQVLVTEGKVRVDDAAKRRSLLPPRTIGTPPLVVAGERAEIHANSAALARVVPVAPAELERALAWQQRRLEFSGTPLVEVVAEFNRYNRHKLVIDHPDLMQRKFGGTFRTDGYEALVRLLELKFDVVAEQRGDETVLRLAR